MSIRSIGSLVALSALLLSGCGNAVEEDVEPAGVIGLTRTTSGDVAVVAKICRSTIDQVVVNRDREGLSETEKNPTVATYTSSKPLKGDVQLVLARPGASWSPSEPLELEADRGYLISAQGSGDDARETGTVWVTGRLLDTVKAGSIFVDGGNPDRATLDQKTPAQFAAQAKAVCSD
ncbi:MAG: hypothetical protein EON52_13505 [Actinomycetales bacterium]|nr:MAG: hypothetical protein EON52_13505 [Actinomycetales bacterium]